MEIVTPFDGNTWRTVYTGGSSRNGNLRTLGIWSRLRSVSKAGR